MTKPFWRVTSPEEQRKKKGKEKNERKENERKGKERKGKNEWKGRVQGTESDISVICDEAVGEGDLSRGDLGKDTRGT